jgi:antitoxin ParD1/3/4
VRVTLELSDGEAEFVATRVATGLFADAAEVLRAGLSRMAEEEWGVDELRALIAEGEADVAAGRVTVVEPGDIARLMRDAVRRHSPAAE